MSIRRHPYMKDKLITSTWNGCEIVVDATPALLNACTQAEMSAGMSGAQPKRDNATLNDFQAAHPGEGVGPLFYRWCTMNQCTPRHTMNLELQARGQDIEVSASGPQQQRGHTFHPSTMAHTFHPSTMAHTFHPGSSMGADDEDDAATEADPLKRTAQPLVDEDDSPDRQPSDDDINSMTFPRGISLAALKKAGIVHEAMTETEFNARLKRVKVDEPDRMRLTAAGYEAGFFGGRSLSVNYAQPWSSPQGDTLAERNENQPVRTQRDRIRIANEINAACDRILATLHPSSGTARVIHGRAQERR